MKLGAEGYSPGLLSKIEYAGGNNRSFQTAAESLSRLAEFEISAKHVERLTERLGKERAKARDQSAAAMEARQLRSKYKEAPAVAVISVDAGKAQFRTEDKGPGAHSPHWGDTKVACLQTYANVEHIRDPQPEPPEAFLDPARVERLCREMARVRGTDGDPTVKDKDASKDKSLDEEKARKSKTGKKSKKKKKKRSKRPERLVRTVVATTPRRRGRCTNRCSATPGPDACRR